MQRPIIFLFALIVVLCAPPPAAQAQTDQSQKKAEPAAAPVTYVYGEAAAGSPETMHRVRRRIAEIGRRGPARRVSSPIYIILPQGQTAPPPVQPPALTPAIPMAPALPPTQPPVKQFTQQDLDRLEDNLARKLDARFDELDARLAARLAARRDARQDTAPAPDAAPTVQEVEGALLETGLFQTTAVIFEFDQSTLLPVSEKILNVVGDVLARHPEVRLEVAGHTDSAGSDAYNRRLSEARAKAVRDYLLDRFALAPEHIEARGYGETQPVASNADATGRALNRRVAFRVLNPEILGEGF